MITFRHLGQLAAVLILIGVAAALRVPQLELRPMHADEAVQAAIFRDLWQQGQYAYDPHEFHGPTLPYATLPSASMSGADDFAETSEATYRLVPVLFGVGVVLLVFLFIGALDTTTLVVAALLVAVSPSMVFYSRYYIHETLLVFFTLSAIACGWQYVIHRHWLWCLLAGACIGCMQATKETAVLAYLAAALATLFLFGWDRALGQRAETATGNGGASRYWQHLVIGMTAAILVAVTLLSSFFSNLRGPVDGVLTYFTWLERAGGDSPHIHPFFFYLHRLSWWRVGQGPIWSEGLILLLAVVGLLRVVVAGRANAAHSRRVMRWLACYTVLITLIYCVISYKTPWCLLQFLIGMILLAGFGAAGILQAVRRLPLQAIIAALLVAGAGHLGWQAYRASFVFPADMGNPYVYAQTSSDVERLNEYLQALRDVNPQGAKTPVKVLWTDAYYWPLPWYLRKYEHVELWRSMPSDPQAPIVLAAPHYNSTLDVSLGEDYAMVMHELRPQVFVALWVEFELWEKCLRHLGRIE